MGTLDTLFGNQQQQQDYQGFVSRYNQGAPSEGYSAQEVLRRYQQVAPQLTHQEFERAALAAFQRMTPMDRIAFGQMLFQLARGERAPFIDYNTDHVDDHFRDATYLAKVATQAHQQEPGMLAKLLGGDGGNDLGNSYDNPIVKAALAGITAMAVQKFIRPMRRA